MNPKHSLAFFSGGVALVLGFALFDVTPMNIISESKPDDGREQFTVKENIAMQAESKPIDQMDCAELKEFIFSFEDGWGSAVALHYKNRCT